MEPGEDGTRVTFTLPFPGSPAPAHEDEAAAGAVPHERARLTLESRSDGAVLLRISGDVDLSTTEALRDALLAHLRQISGPAVVDLTEVTHLASAGVRLLAETLQTALVPVRVQCPPGSPAHRVLTLTGLDRLPGLPTSR